MSGSRFSSYTFTIRLDTMSDAESKIVSAFLKNYDITDVFVKGQAYLFPLSMLLVAPVQLKLYDALKQLKNDIYPIRFESTLVRINQHEFAVYTGEVMGAGSFGIVSSVCGWLRLSLDGHASYEDVSLIAKYLQASKGLINKEFENLSLIRPRSARGLTFLAETDGKLLEQQCDDKYLKRLRIRQSLFASNLDQHALLIEERVPGKDLEAILLLHRCDFEFISVSQRLLLARNILRAVNLFHLAGWVHRDLTPANIMVDMNNPLLPVAIIDPSNLTSVTIGSTVFAGTPLYAATENHIRNQAVRAKAGKNTPLCLPSLTCAEDVFSLGVVLAEIMCANPAATFPKLPGATDHYQFPELFKGIKVIPDEGPALEPNQIHADHLKNIETLIYKMISHLATNRSNCNDLMKAIECMMLKRQLRATPDKSVRMLVTAAKEGINLREALNKHAYAHQSLQLAHVLEINELFIDALNKIQDNPMALSLFLDRVGVNMLLAPSYLTKSLVENSTSIEEVILFVNVPSTTHELGLTSKRQILIIVSKILDDYLASCNRLLEMLRKIGEINPGNTHRDYAVIIKKCQELSASIREVLMDQRPLSLDHLVDMLPGMQNKLQSIEPEYKDICAKWNMTASPRRCGFFAEKKHAVTNTNVSPGRQQDQTHQQKWQYNPS